MASAGEAARLSSSTSQRPVRASVNSEVIAQIQAKLDLLTAEVVALKQAQN